MKDKAWVHVRQDFDKMSTVGLANKVQTTFKKITVQILRARIMGEPTRRKVLKAVKGVS